MRSFRLAAILSFGLPALVSAALNQAGPSSELHLLSSRSGAHDLGLTTDPAQLVERAAEAVPAAAPAVSKRHYTGVYCPANGGKVCPYIANSQASCGANGKCAYKCLYGLDLVTVKKYGKTIKSCRCNGVLCTEPYPHGIGHVTCYPPSPNPKHLPKCCGIACPTGYKVGELHGQPSCSPSGRLRE